MVICTPVRATLAVAGTLLATACGGGSNVSNASPRIQEVPQQSTLGGSAFTIDLSGYVSDREGATLTYSVVSGGGAFAGSSYTNTFDTIGSYTVQFTVSDGQKTETGTFTVDVTSANLVMVTEDASGVLLLDSATNALRRVASGLNNPVYHTQLGTRFVVYRRGTGNPLFVYDTYSGQRIEVGADQGGGTYRAKTSTGLLIYSTGTAPTQRLWSLDPVTGVARNFAQEGLATQSVFVSDDDLVYFEAGNGGQADVYYYDPSEDEVVTVSEEVVDEQIQGVLANGAVVFSRVGSGGESDLYYYRVGTGVVEIGNDVAALATRNKTFQVSDSNSKVVFTALNGANRELFFWNPATGQTTTIAAGIDTEVFATLGAGNELIYYDVQSATEWDAMFYDLDDGTAATLRNDTDRSLVGTVTGDGTTNWALIRPTGSDNLKLAVSLVGTPSTQTWDATTSQWAGGVLTNGDYVAERVDGTALNVFDVSAGTWGTPITGTGLDFGGDGIDAGDFVYRLEVAGQDDLSMWDASAGSPVVVSSETGDDSYLVRTLDGTILFTRVVGTNTTADLFVWDGTTEVQLTDDSDGTSSDYTVIGVPFSVTRF